jgi:hypothetical protein
MSERAGAQRWALRDRRTGRLTEASWSSRRDAEDEIAYMLVEPFQAPEAQWLDAWPLPPEAR